MIYIAKDNERLDSIVYKHYKTLEVFETVLSFNTHLNPILKAGDKVFLPDIKVEKNPKEQSLW
ncbi:phage tail protein [Aliarcobacter skirrowii]|uniref:tail protein X n=1 Tax=Aliarcobacter skirrowii TaxID=28200 RepID=UPI00100B4B1F|nr:tail protein X [Aliarcobacter skirrowii]RXJ80820.1 phage tail protein [Aliarcobacter skirrowii]